MRSIFIFAIGLLPEMQKKHEKISKRANFEVAGKKD